MKWFLFVLFLHGGDKAPEIYRWTFATQAACEKAAEFANQDNKLKATCIEDERAGD